MRSLPSAGLLLFALAGCAAEPDALTPPLIQNSALLEAEVLTVVIKDAAPHADPPLELLLDTTFRPDSSPHGVLFGRRSDSLSLAAREAIADFRLRSPHTEMITAPLQLRTYKWISADDLRRRKPLPLPLIDVRVTITVSHVGFSHDYRTAAVYVGYLCGALCGYGNLVFLQRDAHDAWHITHKDVVWAS